MAAFLAPLAALGGGSSLMGAFNGMNMLGTGLYAIDLFRQMFGGGGGGGQPEMPQQQRPETQEEAMIRELMAMQQRRSQMRMQGGVPWQ
jgi:DnaJ-class molecular chaperone